MKNILLPTDFSDNSWNAIQYAIQLFEHEKCTFYLLNTYTPMIYHVEYVLIGPSKYGLWDTIRETSLKNLEDFKNRINEKFNNTNHSFECISSFNTLIPKIQETIEEKTIDLVVMGTKGASGSKEILFGTNTVHAFKNVKCPVLAIPDDFKFETPHEILFPSDYEINFQDKHIQPILNIATMHPHRVHILNVSYGFDLSKNQEQNKQKLEVYFKKVAHLFHRVTNQNIPDAITNFQLKTRINLLVMINNKHSFFENIFFKSNINHIGFHLNIPFLVIPS